MTEEDREEGFIDWADLSKRMKKEKKEAERKNNPQKVELPDSCVGCLVGCLVVPVLLGAILIFPMFFFMIGFPLMGFAACVLVACVIFKPVDQAIFGKKEDDDDD